MTGCNELRRFFDQIRGQHILEFEPYKLPEGRLKALVKWCKEEKKIFDALWKNYALVNNVPRAARFRLDPQQVGEKKMWHRPDHDDSSWAEIEIGRWWENQGYDYDGVAWYRTKVFIPKKFAGRRIYAFFGAVDEDVWVYVNGRFVGKDVYDRKKNPSRWKTPFKIEITKGVRFGTENQITFRVYDSAYYGGLWKPIKIISPIAVRK